MAVGMTPQALGQMPTTSEPFVWGKGGRRMTPEQIAQEQQIAAALMQPDYSPIESPWQGLARVSGNVLGGLRQRSANKAGEANAAENASIAKLLMSPAGEVPAAGGNPSGGINPAIAQALASPYVDDATRQLAMKQYTAATKRAEPIEIAGKLVDPTTMKVLGDFSAPSEFDRMLIASGVKQGTPEWTQSYKTALQNKLDPWTNIVVGGNSYTGRQSLVDGAINGAQQPAAAPPNILPPDFNFDDGGQTPAASGGFPRR